MEGKLLTQPVTCSYYYHAQWVDISVIATGILGKRNANHRRGNLQSHGYKSRCSLTELQETHRSYGYNSRFT